MPQYLIIDREKSSLNLAIDHLVYLHIIGTYLNLLETIMLKTVNACTGLNMKSQQVLVCVKQLTDHKHVIIQPIHLHNVILQVFLRIITHQFTAIHHFSSSGRPHTGSGKNYMTA